MVSRCCMCFPLDVGSLILGVCTLIASIILGIYSIVLLGLEQHTPHLGVVYMKLMMHLDLDSSALKIVLYFVVIVKVLWMGFSVMLIVGLRKNRPSYLLCYFSFGIMVDILMLLSGLLVLLKQHWVLSLLHILAAIIYMHGLIVVYHTYEMMKNGISSYSDDEEHLWSPEDEDEPTMSLE